MQGRVHNEDSDDFGIVAISLNELDVLGVVLLVYGRRFCVYDLDVGTYRSPVSLDLVNE